MRLRAAVAAFGRGVALGRGAAAGQVPWGARRLAHSTEGPESESPRRNLMMVFTCGQCDLRQVKTFSRKSYEEGYVPTLSTGL